MHLLVSFLILRVVLRHGRAGVVHHLFHAIVASLEVVAAVLVAGAFVDVSVYLVILVRRRGLLAALRTAVAE